MQVKKLRVNLKHPMKKFRIGRHVVGKKAELFELNEDELKELESDGCKKWLIEEKVAEQENAIDSESFEVQDQESESESDSESDPF